MQSYGLAQPGEALLCRVWSGGTKLWEGIGMKPSMCKYLSGNVNAVWSAVRQRLLACALNKTFQFHQLKYAEMCVHVFLLWLPLLFSLQQCLRFLALRGEKLSNDSWTVHLWVHWYLSLVSCGVCCQVFAFYAVTTLEICRIKSIYMLFPKQHSSCPCIVYKHSTI